MQLYKPIVQDQSGGSISNYGCHIPATATANLSNEKFQSLLNKGRFHFSIL